MEVSTLSLALLAALTLTFPFLTTIIQAQNSPQNYLDAHNSARDEVGVGKLAWSNNLESYAQSYANRRAADCLLIHSQGPYGENIYIGYGEGYSDGVDAVRYWYDEKQYYNYEWNQCLQGMECLHYTQMVWRDSTKIGCARTECVSSPGKYFINCNYDPPGNIWGEWPY